MSLEDIANAVRTGEQKLEESRTILYLEAGKSVSALNPSFLIAQIRESMESVSDLYFQNYSQGGQKEFVPGEVIRFRMFGRCITYSVSLEEKSMVLYLNNRKTAELGGEEVTAFYKSVSDMLQREKELQAPPF